VIGGLKMNNQNSELLTNYLKEVRKKLPDWLKDNQEEVADILSELEEHILDHASEISGIENPDSHSIELAIEKMGSPEKIAHGYKQRGTPKYFISEELWSTYTKVLSYLIPITYIVMTLVQVVIADPNNFIQALLNGITSSYTIIITFILVVTAIFVGLSFEGYFPQDLGTQDTSKDELKDPMLKFYKPNEFLVNGLVGMLFSLLIIIVPIDMINLFRIIVNFIIGLFNGTTMPIGQFTMSTELQIFLTLIGLAGVITGVVNLLKIRTKEYGYQINMNVVLIITGIADFGLSLYLLVNLHLLEEVLPVVSENILIFLALLGVFGTIVELLKNISHNLKIYNVAEEAKTSSFSANY
jgi:hypothetical protein